MSKQAIIKKVLIKLANNDVKKELQLILNTMDVPEIRKDLNEGNIRWLGRNLIIRNKNHKDIVKALQILKNLGSPLVLGL